ncbi:MAG TPA: MlaD family protein [Terracidiphilus sp.]|jgi:outer membrane protein OmpA-like peptidoglycan-associated protein|nr:MlaD family protein [Terracidiphilus sp.]
MSRLARLGAFIVATLAVLATGVFIIGSKEYLFASTYQLKAQFDNVAGLADGADVQVGGVHSGMVTGIELPRKPGEKVTVIMELAKSTREIIKHDSVVSIQTEGLLGNQFLAVSFGSAGQADVMDGEIIKSAPPLLMADLFKKSSSILDDSQEAIQSAATATAHLNSVSAKIDSGQGTVGALVNDKQLYNNLAQTTATLDATMLQAQSGVTDFRENMEALKHNLFLNGYFKKRGYVDSSELAANRIAELPTITPEKTFIYGAKQLFDGRDSAKIKNKKTLQAAGDFLAQAQFGVAVVIVSTAMDGDTKKDQVLTEARAMVIREYLVENFGFDDSKLKTLGLGKQAVTETNSEWGSVQILIFPNRTEVPETDPVGGSATTTGDSRTVPTNVSVTHKP